MVKLVVANTELLLPSCWENTAVSVCASAPVAYGSLLAYAANPGTARFTGQLRKIAPLGYRTLRAPSMVLVTVAGLLTL